MKNVSDRGGTVKRLIVLFLFFILSCTTVWAKNPTVIDGYSETNVTSYNNVDYASPLLTGQSFSVSRDYFLTSCQFYLKTPFTPKPTGTIMAELYTHTGTYGSTSKPSDGASPLAVSGTLDVSTISDSPTFYTFTFDGTYQLVAGEKYIIILNFDGLLSQGVSWSSDDSGIHSGNMSYSTDSGSTWSYDTDGGFDTIFYVYGTKKMHKSKLGSVPTVVIGGSATTTMEAD